MNDIVDDMVRDIYPTLDEAKKTLNEKLLLESNINYYAWLHLIVTLSDILIKKRKLKDKKLIKTLLDKLVLNLVIDLSKNQEELQRLYNSYKKVSPKIIKIVIPKEKKEKERKFNCGCSIF